MILFHGTSANRLAPILRDGIQPRGRKKGNWSTNVESHTQMVYLTSNILRAQFYAVRAGLATDTHVGVVIQLDTERLDQSKLRVDENFFSTGVQCTFETRRRQRVSAGNDTRWEDCLRKIDICAYRGTIPPEAIVEHNQLNIKQQFWYHPFLDEYHTVHDRCLAFDSLLNALNVTMQHIKMRYGLVTDTTMMMTMWRQLLPFCGHYKLMLDGLAPIVEPVPDTFDAYHAMRKT